MSDVTHPNWEELVDAVEAGDGAPLALRRATSHARSCPGCRRHWDRIETLLSLLKERASLRGPSRSAIARALLAVREQTTPRPLSGLPRVWAVPVVPTERPTLRSAPLGATGRFLFTTDQHRIALTMLTRDDRRVLRGQIVPDSGPLPTSRALYTGSGSPPIPIDRFGEFVLDPMPEGLQDLEIQLGDLVVQLSLPNE